MAPNHVHMPHVRPVYGGPARDHASRVDVGVRAMAARQARESVARAAVGLLGVATDAALPGGVARVDVADRYARTLGLVGDLRLEVTEGPGVQDASLRTASPY